MLFGRKRDVSSVVDLPITPMLDMAFQLLTFFVFTYHPSALEGQMALRLPAKATGGDPPPIPAKPLEAELDARSAFTVVVTAGEGRGGSAPVQYVVETPAGTTVPIFALTDLEDYLVKTRKTLGDQDEIKIQADSTIKYAFVVKVMDLCTSRGGFRHVGFAAPPDLVDEPMN